jgi:hypothetical protein
MEKIKVKWLGERPVEKGGVTWGIPWKKGSLDRNTSLSAEADNGDKIVLQSWPTAYWPDGSVKWTAHASSFTEVVPKEFYVLAGKEERKENSSEKISVKETAEAIEIDTGAVICSFNKKGSNLINNIKIGDNIIGESGRLIALLEQRNDNSGFSTTVTTEYFSSITEATIEQIGHVRCVVRIRGTHLGVQNSREMNQRKFVPFDVRFYLYAGQESIKMVHTAFYNGNPNTDFIKGLGMKLSVPQSGELYNRHIRFAGDTGLFREMSQNLSTWRTTGKYAEMFMEQVQGKELSFDAEEDSKFLGLLEEAATWDDFKMVQLVPDDYTIYKRAKEGCTYVKAVTGRRSMGLAFVGGQRGGMAVGMKNFWQKCPSSLEVKGMKKPEAELIVWFWSPDANAMDLRHYDTEAHMLSGYEGYQEIRSTPNGIANTNEVTLWCFDNMPTNEKILNLAKGNSAGYQTICEPKTYREAGVFGEWSLVDRSTEERAYVEDQLDAVIGFYKEEIESRKWYGFWDYGDVMHSYDIARHSWRYDIGGYAWQNSELMPNMWLWYSFLRTGREDVYKLAEAMTRHCSEVDVYHFGEYAGLGSRHNVVHWGCSCKEARISMAALNRYFFYLTADERMGDLLDEVKDSDIAVSRLDPLRAVLEKNPKFDVHVRMGPDIMAFCSNWFTQWERHESTEYRDKLFKTLDFIKENPYRFIAGKAYGYNPLKTEYIDVGVSHKDWHFHFCFGSQFIWLEIAKAMGDGLLEEMCMDLGQFFSKQIKNKEEVLAYWGVDKVGLGMQSYNTGLASYAANKRNNPELAQEVWEVLLVNPKKAWMELPVKAESINEEEYPIAINEIKSIGTNSISQWTINTIMSLEFIGDLIPKDFHKTKDK